LYQNKNLEFARLYFFFIFALKFIQCAVQLLRIITDLTNYFTGSEGKKFPHNLINFFRRSPHNLIRSAMLTGIIIFTIVTLVTAYILLGARHS